MSDKFDQENGVPPVPIEPIDARLLKWFPHLSKSVVEQLSTFHAELLKYNQTVSLIAPTTAKNADIVHFADTILASQLIRPSLRPNAPLYDLGAGNGFPGLVFGILYPETAVLLIERDSKKVEFLKHMRSLLDLPSVEVRLEELEKLKPGTVENAVARELGPLHKVMLSTRQIMSVGGKFFHLKPDSWAQEIAVVPSQLFSVWSPSMVGQYRLPETGVQNAVVLTEKISS